MAKKKMKKKSRGGLYLGVDLGGTNIDVGIVNKSGKVLSKIRFLTEVNKGKKQVLNNIFQAIEEMINDKIKGIGIGVPSLVDNKKGVVYETTNIPGWDKINLKQIIQKKFKKPVFVDNDANCFVMAEHKYGAAKSNKNVVGIVIGTGLGSGLILNGKLYRGILGAGGEIGVIPYKGISLENYAAGAALKRLSNYMGKRMNASQLCKLAAKRNAFAKQVFDEYGTNISVVISMVYSMLTPDMIVLGGGVAKAFPYFKQSMLREVKKSTFNALRSKITVVKGKVKDAGIVGAAMLCYEKGY